MDFDEVVIAGKHQWERLKERTDESNIHDVIRNGKAVLIKGNHKFYKHNDIVIPIIRIEDGKNIVRTVLDRRMYIYESEDCK